MFSRLWIYSVSVVLTSLCTMAHAVTTTCMAYESFPLNASYTIGTNQIHGDIFSELVAFQEPDGSWAFDGLATITAANMAKGSGNEVNLNNINQRFIFNGDLAVSATFKYADWGGNVNLGVNGTLNNVEDMSDLNGLVVNDILIVVTRTDVFGGHYGTVALIAVSGGIERFGLGGQEFFADDVCVQTP